MSIITDNKSFLNTISETYFKNSHSYFIYKNFEECVDTEYGDMLGGKTKVLRNIKRKVKVSASEYNESYEKADKITKKTTYTLGTALSLINKEISECKDNLAGNKKKLNLYKKKIKLLNEITKSAKDFEKTININAVKYADIIKSNYKSEMKVFSSPFIEEVQLNEVKSLIGDVECRIIELEHEKVKRATEKRNKEIEEEIARLQKELK